MYLIWTAVYFPLAIYNYRNNRYSVSYSIIVTVRKLIFRGENYNSWMLWYLLATIYALVVILVTMKRKWSRSYLPVITVVMLFACGFINKIAWSTESLPTALELIRKLIYYTITDARVLSGIGNISLGIFISKYETEIKKAKYLLVPAFIGLVLIQNDILSKILEIVANLAVFGLALSITPKNRPIYKTLRNSSTHSISGTYVCRNGC